MAICGDCGAASAEGAARCAACGWSFAIGAVEFGDGGTEAPEQQGSWGAGVVVASRPRPAAVRWFTDADWRPALRAVAAPTALLLVVPLLLAFGANGEQDGVGFGTRFGGALALALTAFGGPVGVRSRFTDGEGSFPELVNQFWLLPMTITLLWALLFGYGLRAARRRLAAGSTGRQQLADAGRPVLLAVAVTVALGLLGGAEHTAGRGRVEPTGPLGLLFQFGYARHVEVSAGTGWSALGTAVLATALAAGVYAAPWLRRKLGDRAASAAAAGRALLLTVLLAGAVALVLLGSLAPLDVTLVALVALPNVGLILLGFGSGATAGIRRDRTGVADSDLQDGLNQEYSLFDPAGQSGQWWWSVLLAVAVALLLGWLVRRFDLRGRLRAAGVFWGGASVLTLLATISQRTTMEMHGGEPGFDPAALARTDGISFGLAPVPALVALLLWTALGALVLAPLLGRLSGAGPADGASEAAAAPADEPSALPPKPTYVPFTGEVLDSHGPDLPR
ncbi:hypothetical protein [Kitasatospora sp. NPDC002040]|uniref:hypothetical protein n=1 Tax=Kitasatospora sp. NPDC002040 TaxID=3154661 RepID=UPI00331A1314